MTTTTAQNDDLKKKQESPKLTMGQRLEEKNTPAEGAEVKPNAANTGNDVSHHP